MDAGPRDLAPETSDAPSRRAPALSPGERRAQIIDATIPLLLAHGGGVTSRQIAEAASVAEGTVFRAFGDKDAVIRAAVAKYLDPQPLREGLRDIDPALPLELKVRRIVSMLQQRFRGIFSMMAAVGLRERPSQVAGQDGWDYAGIVARLVEPDLERLSVSADRVAPFLRLLAFASSIEQFQAPMPIDLDELVDLAVHGLVGARADAGPSAGRGPRPDADLPPRKKD
ncbi:MAG TPA: TetR/AcrR family transcriptional regulator [Gryllotalpicola sp.]